MAEDGPLTPEKQLLKLIEGSKGAASGGGGRSSPRQPKRSGGSLLSFGAIGGALSGRLSFFKRLTGKNAAVSRKKFRLSLTLVNRLLMVGVAALFIYLVVDTVAAALQANHPPILDGKKSGLPEGPTPRISPLNESAYYLQKVNARDIFKEGGRPAPPRQETGPELVPVDSAMSALSLVGISWSSNPDVIIEDKEQKRTYFVKRGQNVGEGIKVEAIFKDHVVLSHEGREFELR